MRIYKTMYKDIPAVACESETLTALFLPEYGAKLASLKQRDTGREFMEQTKGETYLKPVYGGVYTEAECSAFDDMFPTIDACVFTDGPWKGVEYPDHGEVYALRWDYEILEDCLHMWVYSVRFGYRLDKWVIEEEGAIVARYKVQNLTDFDFDYMYVTHCMFQSEEGMELELPYENNAMATTVFSKTGRIGTRGTKVRWPINGDMDFSKVGSRSDQDNYKILFDDPIPEGKCILKYPDGTKLTVRFDERSMPYMEIWYNCGVILGKYNVALEPGTGAYDRPDVAKLYGKNSVLKGRAAEEWFMSFAL